MAKKIELDINEISRLYLEERMSFANIGKLMGCSGDTIGRNYKKNGGVVRTNAEQATKYNFNEDYFGEINSCNRAYWLGFIYADGFITNNSRIGIKLKKDDSGHLQKFLDCLDSNHPINIYKNNSGYGIGGDYCEIALRSDRMCKDLESLGVIKNKSLKLNFPNKKQVSEEFIWDFIRGYFDGDGSIYFRTNSNLKSINIVGTEEFLNEMNRYLLVGHIHKEKRSSNNTFYLQIGKQEEINKIRDKFYANKEVYLDRKKEIFYTIR